MKYRFVGGSQHGTIRALQYSAPYVVFPVYNQRRAAYLPEYVYEPVFTEEVYERRTFAFGTHARIELMALRGMGEAEFMRRCADIMEGV